ncbi:MAG: sugar ABC transporter permease [Spirochaetaceae bacterium 4572_7]|nr:MAG: sugar ABC transporter permease [Spirochaetaceae bacterium 4572_7]
MDTVLNLFPYAIAFTIPLLITSLGGLFSERSGVVNIGLEGLMVIGSFASALVISLLQDILPSNVAIWIGLSAAMIAGALFSLLHAFASITLNADQVISGTAINMIAGALTVFIARSITGSGLIRIRMGFTRYSIPVLKDIPFIGKMFFTNTYPSTWLVIGLLLGSWFVIYKTAFGLRLRACGEHPQAADAAGIKVHVVRYISVLISGAFAGLGGAVILVTYSGEFSGSVAGLGFLALAALIFGQWKPLGILGATFFFGFASTIANVSQVVPALTHIPGIILKVFPYVMTLFALIFFSKNSQAPKAVGEPFDSGKR